MAVSVVNGYVSAAELTATLGLTGETFASDDIARAINAASRLIDSFCGQRFWVDPSNVTRQFTAAGFDAFDFGLPLATLVTFKTDQDQDGTYETTWTVNTDFWLTPDNAAADGVPFSGVLRNGTVATNVFPTWQAGGVQIVGKWGWAAVPDTVVEACIIQSSRLLKRAREAPFGIAGLAFEGGGIRLSARLDPDVEVLLAPYDIRQRVR